jgi:hypothetical protein
MPFLGSGLRGPKGDTGATGASGTTTIAQVDDLMSRSFYRDFAALKTLDHGTGPAITFTRASGATYFDVNGVLQTAANDAPRFDHDPANGALSRGLLIEEARTNLVERSSEFNNAYWAQTRATITANAVTAPDGTLSADKLVEDASASADHFVSRTLTGSTNTVYSASVFFKSGERSRIRILIIAEGALTNRATAFFDSATGTVISTLATGDGAVSSASIVDVGGGWYRAILVGTPSSSNSGTAPIFNVTLIDSGTNATYTGNGTSGLYIWGAQLEAGAFPTSYIPTTTAAATRAADSAIVTPISSFYNQVEGTLFAEARSPQAAAFFIAQAFSDGTANDELRQGSQSSGANPQFVVNDGAATQASVGVTLSANTAYKIGSTYTQDSFNCAVNGTLGTADTSGSVPSVDRLTVGARGPSTLHLNGHIRKIAYWPKRLSNTLLEQITT